MTNLGKAAGKVYTQRGIVILKVLPPIVTTWTFVCSYLWKLNIFHHLWIELTVTLTHPLPPSILGVFRSLEVIIDTHQGSTQRDHRMSARIWQVHDHQFLSCFWSPLGEGGSAFIFHTPPQGPQTPSLLPSDSTPWAFLRPSGKVGQYQPHSFQMRLQRQRLRHPHFHFNAIFFWPLVWKSCDSPS